MSPRLRATTSDKQECHQGFLGRLGRKEGRREQGKERKKRGVLKKVLGGFFATCLT